MGVGRAVSRRKNRHKRGKSFCHVERIRQSGHLRPAITFGNQKWRGAAPNFSISPRRRSHLGSIGWRTGEAHQIPPSISDEAPRICLRRYFVADSCSVEVLPWIIKGTKARRLSSIPAKTESQFVEQSAVVVPVMTAAVNRMDGSLERNIRLCFGRVSRDSRRFGEN